MGIQQEDGPMEQPARKSLLSRLWRRDQEQDDYLREDEPPPRGATILIVDDSRTLVHALKSFLEQAGFATATAFDGIQGIEAARSHRPDLILMDIVMPNMNGFEATRALKRDPETAAIPVVIVSGAEQPADRVWGTRLGAKGYLAKPLRKDRLLETINQVLADSRAPKTAEAEAGAPTPRNRRIISVT
jgi:twitching motility two-component system response regulator PilH